MNRTFISILTFGFCLSISAQEKVETFTNDLGQTITVTKDVVPTLSIPVKDLPALTEEELKGQQKKETRNLFLRNKEVNENALPVGPDPAWQFEPAYRAAAGTGVNKPGQSGGFPPDPSGAIGPNHYVQAVNTSYRVFSTTGSNLTPSFSLSSLWPGSTNAGDPIVLYDKHADRWFISQFQFNNHILIAISETPDPTGSYYLYDFNMGSSFPDYPKFSIWWDGYYMTSNSNNTAVVFERSEMLNGNGAMMIRLTAPGVQFGFKSVLPADADGDLPPNGTPCYFFNLQDDAWSGVNQDRIRIYEMNTDWNNSSNTTVSISQTLNTDPFSTSLGFGFDNISQPGTSQKIDAISGVFMYRAQHTRWPDHNSIVLTHVVDADGQNLAGVRWYELRDDLNGNWSIYQQSTYAPNGAHRWMSSAAMDVQGNIAMAYSYTDVDNTIYPGLRFTGRLANDPLDQMTFFEYTAIDGSASQTGGNRYGDYSQMSVDPVSGTTFWYTGEYIGNGGNTRTRIFNFDLSASVGIDDIENTKIELLLTSSSGLLSISANKIQSDEEILVDIIDIRGKQLMSKQLKAIAGSLSTSFDVSSLAPAVYFIRIGNSDLQKVERIFIGQ